MDTRDLVLNASQLSGFDCTYTAWSVCMSVWYRLTQRQHNTEKRKQSHKFCSYLHMCIVFHQFFLLSRRLFLDVSTYTHIHPFNGPFFGTTRVSQYQKSKTNLDFTEARDSEWQWHQLGHMQVCILLQTDNHASTPPLSFFKGQMPFLPPNQQRQSTEGQFLHVSNKQQNHYPCSNSHYFPHPLIN